MKPIVGLTDALVVTKESDEFVSAFGSTDRRSVHPDALAQFEELCDANDYDVKFELVTGLVGDVVSSRDEQLSTAIDQIVRSGGPEGWLNAAHRYRESVAIEPRPVNRVEPQPRGRRSSRLRAMLTPRARRAIRRPLAFLARVLPSAFVERVPHRLRRFARDLAIG
jgi:hypothetical protein